MNVTLHEGAATGPTKTFSTCSFNPANMIVKPASSQDTSADAWVYQVKSTPWPGDPTKTFKYIDIEVRNARLIAGLTLTNPNNAIIQPWSLKYNADLNECFFMDSNIHSHAVPVGEKPDDWDARWRDKYYLRHKRMWGGGTNGPNKDVTWFSNPGDGTWNSQTTYFTIDDGYEPTRVYVAPSGLAFGVAEILNENRITQSSVGFGFGRFCRNTESYNYNYVPWRYPGASGNNIFGQTDIRYYFAPGGFNQQADFTAKNYIQMVSFNYDGEDYIGYAIIWFNADGIPLNAACYGASAFAWGEQGGGGEYSGPTSVPAGGNGRYTDTNINIDVTGVNGSRLLSGAGGFKTYELTSYGFSKAMQGLFLPGSSSSFDKVVAQIQTGVIDCYALPLNPPTTGNINVTILGEWIVDVEDTSQHLSAPIISQDQTFWSAGFIDLTELYYDNFLDFEPYTTVQIYIPFIGSFNLPTSEVIGGIIELKFMQDNYTGDLTAFVSTTNQFGDSHLIGQYSGNGKYAIPITAAAKNNNALTSALAAGGTIAAGAATGAKIGSMIAPGAGTAIGMVAGGTVATLAALPDIASATGAPPYTGRELTRLNGNQGWIGCLTPYITVTRAMYDEPETQGRDKGYTSNITVQLSELTGFAIIKNFEESGLVYCTEQERAEILLLLSKGVYFKQLD